MTLSKLELSHQRGMQPYLLYVFRTISKMARMMMIPMTMTAIIAPEPEKHREGGWRSNYHVGRLFLHFTHSPCGVVYFACPAEVCSCLAMHCSKEKTILNFPVKNMSDSSLQTNLIRQHDVTFMSLIMYIQVIYLYFNLWYRERYDLMVSTTNASVTWVCFINI